MKAIFAGLMAAALIGCGGAPATDDNPLCTRNGDCAGTQICCSGVCEEPNICATADTVSPADTSDIAETTPDTPPAEETTPVEDTAQETTPAEETTADTEPETMPAETSDTTQPEVETVADTTPADTADTASTETVADTTDTTQTDTTQPDTRVPEGYVLVDPGIHAQGQTVKSGSLMLLDGRLDGRTRVCTNNLCVEAGLTP